MNAEIQPSQRQNGRRRVGLLSLLALAAGALCATPAAAQCGTGDYTVTNLADSGAGSLRAAFPYLASTGGTQICFSVTGTIVLASPISIGAPVTINDPSQGGITLSGNNQVQVLTVTVPYYLSGVVRLNGLTLSNGSAVAGGALQVGQQTNVTLVGTVISNNTASEGGAVYNQGTLNCTSCLVSENSATSGNGGGIFNFGGSSLTLNGTTVSSNTSAIGYGGGLYNSGAVSLTGGIFTQNAAISGGAIYNDGNGVITQTNGGPSNGTLFSLNTASQDGGAIYNYQNLTLNQDLFTGNSANAFSDAASCGGAICNESNATISESTFAGNTTNGRGGAIDNYATLTLSNDTISTNTSALTGGGLSVGGTNSLTINNTIIAGNTNTSSAALNDCDNCSGVTGSNNLIGVTVQLGPLALNGGPTQTMMPLPGSAAVNGGGYLTVQDDYDQRGFNRFSATNGVDIGAVQTHYTSVAFVTQPSNAVVGQTIVPPVAVQVVETDPVTAAVNYPLGVPVTVSLLTSPGGAAAPGLSGTLTQLPTVTGGVTAAVFPNLAVSTAGNYELFATDAIASNSSSADPIYHANSNAFTIANPAVVTLAWNPAPVTYGPMPAGELNATATINNVPSTGTFVYTFTSPTTGPITPGQIYAAGVYGVQVTYTPTGSTSQYTLGTQMQITQATPTITWPTPAPIYTSTPLSATQLDATATGVVAGNLAGTFIYKPTVGTTLTAGPQVLTVAFTPTDTTDYTNATGQVTIQVNAVTAASVSIAESAASITFGQSVTFTATVTGTDGKPFSGGTASFTSDGVGIGSAAVTNGTAAISTTAITGGAHTIGVSYTVAGLPGPLTSTIGLTVTKAAPVITWPTPAAIYTTTPLSTTQLDATATGVGATALAGTFAYTPAAGATLPAGAQLLSTTFTPTDAVDYATATAQVTIQVNATTAASVAIQESANPITFGQTEMLTALVTGTDSKPFSGGTATFTSDGTAIGSVAIVNGTGAITTATLTAGTHTIGVSYTVAGLEAPLTSTASLTVSKATPVLTWATPAAIYTTTPLSATQLDATAKGVGGTALAGTFAYTPAAGATLPAGAQLLSTTFTPTDAVDYATATAQVTIQVNAATAASVAIQESANPITFGQTETLTAVVTGSDSKPFSGGTATFTSDGTAIGSVAIVNGTGAITTATLTAGTHTIGVSYTVAGLAAPLTSTASLTVSKATPVLTWATPAPIYTTTALSTTQLDATAAGVGGTALAGTFAYTPAAGATLPAGAQTLSTTFTPTDAVDYATATAQVTIQVNAATAASVTIQESANPITFGQTETLTAVVTGSDSKPFSGGTASFTSDGIAIGSGAVTNGTGSITIATLTAGTHQIGVSFTVAGLQAPLTSAASLTVNKATPVLTWATPAAIYTTTPLSATQLDATAKGVTGAALPGTFAYTPAAGVTLTAGAQVLSTTFTPTDAVDYAGATAQVTIQVNAATAASVAIQLSANPVTYGQTETLTASVTGTDSKPFSGGTANFRADGVTIGAAAVVNGTASITSATLTAGTHQIGVSYTNATLLQALTATTTLTVNKATPVLAWATPAAIYTSTPLSGTQLNATATGVTNTALAGTFAYNPAAGATLQAGTQTLNTTFTPTDAVDYTTATARVTIQVNVATAASVVIQESANPITYGQSETLTALVNGSDGKPYSGGTASFTSDGTSIGSATVVNGLASVTVASLTAGTHQIGVSYTSTTVIEPLTAGAALTVNKAAPTLTWATPAAINTLTQLSATQLDATAAGVTGAALAGTFVYNPAAGTLLTQGPHALSTTFTPTDTADYSTATAQVTIQVGYSPLTITTVTPNSTPLSTTPLPIVVTGTGFTAASVIEVNGTPLATTVTNATTLGATLPAADLASVGSLNLTVYDSTSKLTSNVFSLAVTAPAANVSISVEGTATSGAQPTITITLNSPYPSDLAGTLTLSFTPASASGVDDPAVQFATGGRTMNFTIPGGSTTAPQVALQTGTVAGTITVTLTLTAGGVNVTPQGLAPITLVIAPEAPVITSVTFSNNSSGLIVVTVSGFSNTRDVTQANFVFTGTGAGSLGTSSKVDVQATTLFAPWYSAAASDQYGSEFTYTQNFQLSKPDTSITGVTVTLSNSIGISGSVNSQ
ncbi:MAG TPA: Ig-like domain repeat protein [Terracidiphilus sp.]|jgi:hypothetical protein